MALLPCIFAAVVPCHDNDPYSRLYHRDVGGGDDGGGGEEAEENGGH